MNPVLLGRGVPLLREGCVRPITLVRSEALPGGVLLTTYVPTTA